MRSNRVGGAKNKSTRKRAFIFAGRGFAAQGSDTKRGAYPPPLGLSHADLKRRGYRFYSADAKKPRSDLIAAFFALSV